MMPTRASLEAMPYRTLVRWARHVRGYSLRMDRGWDKPRLIDHLLALEAKRQEATA